MEYRYPHFKRELLAEDSAFERGPSPGQPMPDFDLSTTDGGRVGKSDFVGERPLLLVFSSYWASPGKTALRCFWCREYDESGI